MQYSRPATAEDFKECEIEYDHSRYMSNSVKTLIEHDQLHVAVKQFRAETGLGLNESKKHCETYQRYLFAKRDFEAGKPVFVSY